MTSGDRLLTAEEAYEAAYRFVWQYAQREPDSESLQLMLVAMEPASDAARTEDPASWEDWLECVSEVGRTEIPRFPLHQRDVRLCCHGERTSATGSPRQVRHVERMCEVCGGSSMLYCDAHDADLCASCDRWLSSVCGDAECPLCPGRPDRPSECRHDEDHSNLFE